MSYEFILLLVVNGLLGAAALAVGCAWVNCIRRCRSAPLERAAQINQQIAEINREIRNKL